MIAIEGGSYKIMAIFKGINLGVEFLESNELKLILSLEKGQSYVLVFLFLIHATTDTCGYLSVCNRPMTLAFLETMLDRRFDTDTIEEAIDILYEYGLISQDENGIYYICNYKNFAKFTNF